MRTAVLVMELWGVEELELEDAEGVMVLTPPPMVEMMTSPAASVAVITWPLVKEEEAEDEVVVGVEDDSKEVVGVTDGADVDSVSDEVGGALEVASTLELEEAGTRVDPGAMGGTGVATWSSEVDAGAGVDA